MECMAEGEREGWPRFRNSQGLSACRFRTGSRSRSSPCIALNVHRNARPLDDFKDRVSRHQGYRYDQRDPEKSHEERRGYPSVLCSLAGKHCSAGPKKYPPQIQQSGGGLVTRTIETKILNPWSNAVRGFSSLRQTIAPVIANSTIRTDNDSSALQRLRSCCIRSLCHCTLSGNLENTLSPWLDC